jgi:hypothetical protein
MEPVVYRKSENNPPAFQADFDVLDRVAKKVNPTVSNQEAYNAIYPSHKSWYDEKKYKVLDENFMIMEKSLLNAFQDTLDKGFDKEKSKTLTHAEDFDRSQFDINSIDFSKVPSVNPRLIKGDDYNLGDTRITTSDPYNEIFGDKRFK